MDIGVISVRYARALLKSATDAKIEDAVYTEMQQLAKSYVEVPQLRFTIDNPMLSKDKKEALLLTAAGQKPSDLTKAFVQLVLKEDRESVMQFIANSYVTLYRQQKNVIRGRLITAAQVSPATEQKMRRMVESKTNGTVEFETEVNPDIIGGFILEYDTYRLDASVKSKLNQVLLDQLKGISNAEKFDEVGTVLTVSDGVARIYGLRNAEANELLEFENGTMAIVMNLEEDNVGCVLLGTTSGIKEGMVVKRTKRIASIRVNDNMLGRVINPLGEAIDGKGDIDLSDAFEMPLDRKAPGVIYRQPVKEPLQTGLKAIDSMIPIGRGQRELIIGDRQTGKTAIAVDTIINQKSFYEAGKPVYCIYVAIGQKASTVAALVSTLQEHGAMPYTIVVAATAADPAAMQYYAPFAGAAIGEYFRDRGLPALVVYDDLSKQAVAYREVSLILRRPSGREAYPGDVFYLHSRLLERAAKMNEQQEVAEQMNDLPECMKGHVKGGGSLTALPIIETQAGDVSAYIPTNVISITDGQIFLESDLFNQGFRPAINVGISVSRVGGSAQIKSMKKVAGTLKIDQAQYRELEAFSKFSSDMDAVTAMTLDRGRKNNQLLIQPQYSPMPVGEQIAILYCGVHGLMREVPIVKVRECQNQFLDKLRSANPEVIETLASGKIDDETTAKIEAVMADIAGTYKS